MRTGYRFPVVKIGAEQAGTTATCRFYGRPEAKIDSHFYSSKLLECEEVKKKFPLAWQFEAEEVFRAFAVNPETGQCPVDTGPVYRLGTTAPTSTTATPTSSPSISRWSPRAMCPKATATRRCPLPSVNPRGVPWCPRRRRA